MLVSWDKVNIFHPLGISRQQNVIEMFYIYRFFSRRTFQLSIDNDIQTVASAMASKMFLWYLTFGQTLGSLERL